MDELLKTFLQKVKERFDEQEWMSINIALDFATQAHAGQKRETNEDYIIHPIHVAIILLDLGLDSDTVIAGLLHDVVEDTTHTLDEIRLKFGQNIAEMVEAVTKIGHLPLQHQGDVLDKEMEQADNIRKLFIAMARNIRVLLVKLADRLHNMRTLDAKRNKQKQMEKARETLDIYAPLAGRLGINNIKSELEDLSMKYLYPEEYDMLRSKIGSEQEERMKYVQRIQEQLQNELQESSLNLHYEIKGRPKHLYSVFKKMRSQNKTLDEIYDIVAIRVIVETVRDCYAVLGIVHNKWKFMPGRFKDYISSSKPNGYQSLHTTIYTEYGQPFEIQIRTVEMNKIAEYGIAAHWKYKEGRTTQEMSSSDKIFQWIREVAEANKDFKDSKEFMEALKVNVDSEEIYAFTPKGKVISVPKGSTCIDFAYYIHSEVGNKCVGALVNRKIAHLDTVLENGDVVEIKTSSNSKGPSRDWLNIVKSISARTKIRAYFKKAMKEEYITIGKDMLEKEIVKSGYRPSDLLTPEHLRVVTEKYNFLDEDDLYSTLGNGGIKITQILFKLIDHYKKSVITEQPVAILKPKPEKNSCGVCISGLDDCLVHVARCCSPVPNDPIVGYITRGRGVVVHRQNCPNVVSLEKERQIEVQWNVEENSLYNAPLTIETEINGTVLGAITTAIANQGKDIVAINTHKAKSGDRMICNIVVRVCREEEVESLLNKIKNHPSVIKAYRE